MQKYVSVKELPNKKMHYEEKTKHDNVAMWHHAAVRCSRPFRLYKSADGKGGRGNDMPLSSGDLLATIRKLLPERGIYTGKRVTENDLGDVQCRYGL